MRAVGPRPRQQSGPDPASSRAPPADLFPKQDVLSSTSNLHVVCVTAFLCPAGYLSEPVTGLLVGLMIFVKFAFSPTAKSFGVSAQIGSGVVPDGREVRFHERSTRVPPGSNEGSIRVPRGSARRAGWCAH